MKRTKSRSKKRNPKSLPDTENAFPPNVLPVDPNKVPAPDAFLEEAKNEPKRKLITDHLLTINHLRNEKRFTFRAIAEWLTERGITADHSAVYRAYLSVIPEDRRHPDEDWSDIDVPD